MIAEIRDLMKDHHRYLVIAGPTASGKSDLAMKIARNFQGEIINCDSVQVYQDFNIGTAKPSLEERAEIPHHLLDVVHWSENFDARQYADRARQLIAEIRERGRLPIVVGGTGLYLRALWEESWHDLPKDEEIRDQLKDLSNDELFRELEGSDPTRAQQIHKNDRYRLLRAVELSRLLKGPIFKSRPSSPSRRHEAFAVKMEWPRSILHERIAIRSKAMIDAGLVEETQRLIAAGCPPDAKPMQSIGYREVVEMLEGRLNPADLCEKIIVATRQYAKRQETWFRKVEFDYYQRSSLVLTL